MNPKICVREHPVDHNKREMFPLFAVVRMFYGHFSVCETSSALVYKLHCVLIMSEEMKREENVMMTVSQN